MTAAAKPEGGSGFGAVGLVRAVMDHAPSLAADLRAESQQLRAKADENDRHAAVLDQLKVIASSLITG